MNSTILCHALGINLALEQAILYNMNANKQLRIVNRDELVNDISTSPKLIGTSFSIVNCSRGEKNICIL